MSLPENQSQRFLNPARHLHLEIAYLLVLLLESWLKRKMSVTKTKSVKELNSAIFKNYVTHFPQQCRYLSLALKEQDLKGSLSRVTLTITWVSFYLSVSLSVHILVREKKKSFFVYAREVLCLCISLYTIIFGLSLDLVILYRNLFYHPMQLLVPKKFQHPLRPRLQQMLLWIIPTFLSLRSGR